MVSQHFVRRKFTGHKKGEEIQAESGEPPELS